MRIHRSSVPSSRLMYELRVRDSVLADHAIAIKDMLHNYELGVVGGKKFLV